MEIVVLGSGTFMPELNRQCSAYLVKTKKQKLIFDFGRGALNQLLKLKVNLYDLDRIFISHMHPDHSSELVSFILFIICTPEKRKLRKKYFIYGPKGIKKDIMSILRAHHIENQKYLDRIQIKRIQIKEVAENGIIKGKGWEVKSFKVKHEKNVNCLAYRLECDKKVVCYSGDSSYCEELKKACKDVDLAIVEATLPKSWKCKTHLSGEEVGKLAKESNISKLVATHVSSFLLPEIKKEIKENYKGKLIMAKDLMKIEVKNARK